MVDVLDRRAARPSAGAAGRHRPPTVVLRRWPADAGQRNDLLSEGLGCLWVLDVDGPVPNFGPQEDWVRIDTDERDVGVRIGRLTARVEQDPAWADLRVVDGIVRFGGHRATLSELEANLLDLLGRSPGRVVPRSELLAAAWPGTARPNRALTDRIGSLRRRIAPLGLTIHTVRGRGYLLTTTPTTTEQGVPQWSNS